MGLSTNYIIKRVSRKAGKRVSVFKKNTTYPKWFIRKARQFIQRQKQCKMLGVRRKILEVLVLLYTLHFTLYTLHFTLYTASLNLNTATRDELKALPRVGEKRADAIISYREANRGFRSLDEFDNAGIGVSSEFLSQFVLLYAVSKDEWDTGRAKNLESLHWAKLRIWAIECDGVFLYIEFPDGGNALILGGIKNIPAVLRKDPNKFLRKHIIADDYIRRTAGLFGWKPRVDKLIILKLDNTVLEILPIILQKIAVWELYVPIDEKLLRDVTPCPQVSRLFQSLPQKKAPEVFSIFEKIKLYQSGSAVEMFAARDGDTFNGLGLVFNKVKFLITASAVPSPALNYDSETDDDVHIIRNTTADMVTITDGILIYEQGR